MRNIEDKCSSKEAHIVHSLHPLSPKLGETGANILSSQNHQCFSFQIFKYLKASRLRMSLSLLILCVLNEVQVLKMACHLRGRRKKYLRGHLEKEVFPKEVMVIQYGKQKKCLLCPTLSWNISCLAIFHKMISQANGLMHGQPI